MTVMHPARARRESSTDTALRSSETLREDVTPREEIGEVVTPDR
jgi:hypothetical protein